MTRFSVPDSGTREFEGESNEGCLRLQPELKKLYNDGTTPVPGTLFANHLEHTFCGNEIHTGDA